MDEYKRLLERSKSLTLLSSIGALADWDMQTMMPPKAAGMRGEQMALLSQIHHRMATDGETGRLLSKAERSSRLDAEQRRNVDLIRKGYDEQTALPEKLVEEMSRQQVIAVNVWKKAKAAKDYKMFRPELEKMVELTKESADILMKVKGTKTPYDAMLDIYEPKMTEVEIARFSQNSRAVLCHSYQR
jgi:carboxypeptidase Taq